MGSFNYLNKESTFKDKALIAKHILEIEPNNLYLCSKAKIVDTIYFTDDYDREKVTLKLNSEIVQRYYNNTRVMSNAFFEFKSNLIHVLCENIQLKPLEEYLRKPLLLSLCLMHSKISFYQVHRSGGKTHTLTNGSEYFADNSFFENVLLKVSVDEKIIPILFQIAKLLEKES